MMEFRFGVYIYIHTKFLNNITQDFYLSKLQSYSNSKLQMKVRRLTHVKSQKF